MKMNYFINSQLQEKIDISFSNLLPLFKEG